MRAVVFDFFATLTDPAGEHERRPAADATAAALGVEPSEFWTQMSASFTERSTGQLGDTRSTLRTIAARCGVAVAPDCLDRAVVVHLEGGRRSRRPHRRALELLTELSDVGWRLGLLSDCSSELVEVWAETPFAGLFDAVGFSFRLGVRKPDPRGYLAVASQLQVPPEQCWYVGDGSSGELTGAAVVGMRPVLVTNAALAATVTHLRHDPDPYVPAHSIADLADLTSVVGHPTPDVVVTP